MVVTDAHWPFSAAASGVADCSSYRVETFRPKSIQRELACHRPNVDTMLISESVDAPESVLMLALERLAGVRWQGKRQLPVVSRPKREGG